MPKITCTLCGWTHEFPPASLPARDFALYEAGRHYERHHPGFTEAFRDFDARLEDLALLPDTRTEVPR